MRGEGSVVPTFAEATDIRDLISTRRRLRRRLILLRAVMVTLLLAALVVIGFPLTLQFLSSQKLSGEAQNTAQRVAAWPYPKADESLAAARAYNAKLAKSGQPILGEAVDPFSAIQGDKSAQEKNSASSKDEEYQSLLNAGSGVMGSIKIPKISVDLPIYHGTSELTLSSGTGHLYGSSLPVGGGSSHAVITGHRGLLDALMFTRLDEMGKGDFIYFDIMGKTLAYKVDRISVVEPDDTSQLKIVPGEDRVTLVTCTPYGVNTQRLLVSGVRTDIPLNAPEPDSIHDANIISITIFAIALVGGWILMWLFSRKRKRQWRIMHHAAFWPWN